ncbi:hypothetical protein OPV22_020940 [Ensete ventricosum]|uniref:Secreted protein n=1 Tax=Ensete ventricosum TaxID=4639 RepID=A0AAV8QK22_ENSVE|nr:hypothetical protein OPV22_020940 [Ensete ventricosum]
MGRCRIRPIGRSVVASSVRGVRPRFTSCFCLVGMFLFFGGANEGVPTELVEAIAITLLVLPSNGQALQGEAPLHCVGNRNFELFLLELSGLLKSGYFGDNSFPYVKCLTASREMDMVP